MEFPYSEDDYESNNFYLKLFNINSEFNAEEFILADFIKRLIAGDSSSPIIKALEESKLVKDSNCTLYNTINNTSFAISTEGLELKNIAKIDEIIINTLKQIVKDGISKDMIDKELHLVEMANCSMKDNMANKAFYATNMITRFELSNFNKPELYLNPTEGLKILKQQLKNKNAISKFIEEKLLNNTFSTNLTFKATPAKVEEEAKALEKLVADKQASLTESEKQEIIKDSIAFKEFENRDFKGVLPEFSIKDIPSDFTGYRNIETLDYKGTKIYAFKTPTNGISYVNKSTYIQSFDASDLSYLNIYQGLFSLVGYADKTYEQEDDFKFSICDGLNFDIKINEDRYDVEKVYLRADIGSKMLNKNTAVVNNYINEKIAKLRFDEKDRIISQIEKQAMNIKSNFTSYGHELASSLASTKLAPTHNIINKYNGIDSDIFLTKLAKDIKTDDKAYDKLITKMLEIHEKITQAFEKSILLVIDSEDNIENTISDFFDETIISEPNKMAINDNIKTYQPSVLISAETNSNYCVMAINAPYRDHKLSGAYAVLAKIISNDFAHPKFREKGGAYGGFASYNSNNEIFSLLTYMDPALTETFKGFKELAKWLKETEFSNQQLEEGILQVIASFDSPTSVINKCVQATERYLDDIKDHEVKDFRLKVLNATIEQMQEVIDQLILPNLDNAVFTAVANEAQYKQEKLELDTVKFY